MIDQPAHPIPDFMSRRELRYEARKLLQIAGMTTNIGSRGRMNLLLEAQVFATLALSAEEG